MTRAVAVFAKYPEPGKVKTRLAKDIGEQNAADLAQALLLDNLAILNSIPNIHTRIFCAPDDQPQQYQTILPRYYPIQKQQGADLGERMYNAAKCLLKDYQEVAIIGTDCIDFTTHGLQKLFEKLKHNDLSIIPVHDGGYIAIAMTKLYKQIFLNMEWSHSQVLEQTISKYKATTKNKRPAILKPVYDIDEIKDLQKTLTNQQKTDYKHFYKKINQL